MCIEEWEIFSIGLLEAFEKMDSPILIQNHILLHHRRFYVGINKQANAEELLFKTSRAVIDIAEAIQYFNVSFFIIFGVMVSLLLFTLLIKLEIQ